ncbi:hypothetical protein FS749_009229, partial [Ceratobasidium sp. UAMH 11750]
RQGCGSLAAKHPRNHWSAALATRTGNDSTSAYRALYCIPLHLAKPTTKNLDDDTEVALPRTHILMAAFHTLVEAATMAEAAIMVEAATAGDAGAATEEAEEEEEAGAADNHNLISL